MTFIDCKRYGKGKPLALLHGWGCDATVWATLIPLLEHHYELYVVNLPGSGMTSLMDWEDFKYQLQAILPLECSMVGWSLGGLVAMRFCIELPQIVRELIVLASSPCIIQDGAWPGITPQNFAAFYRDILGEPVQTWQQFLKQRLSTMTQIVISPQALQHTIKWLQWDLRAYLSQLSNATEQVLFVFGRLDTLVPYQTMTMMRQQYPQFQYQLFSKATHGLVFSHTAQLAALLGAAI